MVHNHSEDNGNLLFAVVKEVMINAILKMLCIASVDVV